MPAPLQLAISHNNLAVYLERTGAAAIAAVWIWITKARSRRRSRSAKDAKHGGAQLRVLRGFRASWS